MPELSGARTEGPFSGPFFIGVCEKLSLGEVVVSSKYEVVEQLCMASALCLSCRTFAGYALHPIRNRTDNPVGAVRLYNKENGRFYIKLALLHAR